MFRLVALLATLFLIEATGSWASGLEGPATPGIASRVLESGWPDHPGMPAQLLPPIEGEICPGESIPFSFTIRLPQVPARADIMLAFDSTGSMGGVIRAAQENALRIMEDLNSLIPDVRFGIIDIEDYPLDPYGTVENVAYRLRQELTTDREAVRAAINDLIAESGGDLPEAYTRAIYEAHADPAIGWRSDARRLMLTFGDSVPHDDDLNALIPFPQPYRPGLDWRTGFPPRYLDPGRDGRPGTGDDLDFQAEMAALKEHEITLLHVVTSSTFPDPTQSDLVVYWNQWASLTGGRALPLFNASDLPAIIRELVESTIIRINRLAIHVDPELFITWVIVDPPEMGPITVPPAGYEYSFLGRVTPPLDAVPGTYRFSLLAIGDGVLYGERPVHVVVKSNCSPDVPQPKRWFYLPIVTLNYIGSGAKNPPY